MDFNETQTRLHNLLLTEINDQFDSTSAEYAAFKLQITKPLGGAGVLGRCKDLFDIFKQLSKRKKLGVLQYDVLKEAFRGSNNDDVAEMIEEREAEIRAAGKGIQRERTAVASTTLKRKADEEVSSSTSKKRAWEEEDVDPSDGKFVTREALSYYSTDRKTGFLIILNFSEDREGLGGDITTLTGFFEDTLQFDVMVFPRPGTSEASNRPDSMDVEVRDLTNDDVTATLTKVREYLNRNSQKYYCFMCVILAHGNEGTFATGGGGRYEVNKIRRMFTNEAMSSFAGKPKIFIIQTCQGDEEQPTVETNDESDNELDEHNDKQNPPISGSGGGNRPIDESDTLIYIPKDADILFAFANTPGYLVSADNLRSRTFLIHHMLRVFSQWYTRLHLEDMMITVREVTSQEVEAFRPMMPCTWSTLTHRLQFVVGERNWRSKSTLRTSTDNSALLDS